MQPSGLLPCAAAFLLGSSLVSAELAITSHTIDGGGGRSSGSAGGTSFNLTGTVGQVEAAGPSGAAATSLLGGFWRFRTGGSGGLYAQWAAANLPAGTDHSFDGDADADGVANGIEYVFGEDGVRCIGAGRFTAPPAVVPADVTLTIHFSSDLQTWTPLPGGLPVEDGYLVDAGGGASRFYRYEVELVP